MKNYNVTGEDRKRLVQAVSAELGEDPIYTRMPECAYVIGGFKVSRTGELTWDEAADEEAIKGVVAAIEAAGFAEEEAASEAEDELPVEGLTVSFPRADFTEMALYNLKGLAASKATLMKKALHADRLDIGIDDEKVSFPWWDQVPSPEEVRAFTEFLSGLVKMAKKAKRVIGKEHPYESEKYAFRTFLLRLGFTGPEHKETRAILLKPLSGYAAFKNQADADAFYARWRGIREAEKAAAQAETSSEETEEAVDEISG